MPIVLFSWETNLIVFEYEIPHNNNKMKKWANFTIREKSWNSIPFLSTITGASKQHKGMPQKVFHGNVKAWCCFKAWLLCNLLGFFPEFVVDPIMWTTSMVKVAYQGAFTTNGSSVLQVIDFKNVGYWNMKRMICIP